MSQLANRQQIITVRAAQLSIVVKEKLGVELPRIEFDFDTLKGKVAGYARYRPATKTAKIAMNSRLLVSSEEDWQDALEDTLPHEIAHIVCMSFPHFGSGHDAGWKRIAALLGATPNARGINNKIIYGSGDTYTYTDTIGKEHNVSASLHRKIQNGSIYYFRDTKAQLNSSCKYTVANQHSVPVATGSTTASNITAPSTGTKATKARAIMRQCIEQQISYEETIRLMSEGSGYSIALAKACYKDGQEKHGIGK